jgi:hypothetical protein
MYDLLEELESDIKSFSKIDKCEYVIGVEEGETKSGLYKVSNNNLLYMIDNGSPRNNIHPYNLTTRFNSYFKSSIEPRMEERLYDKIIDGEEDEDCIKSVFEEFKPFVLNWYRTEIRKLNVLDFNMSDFAEKIFCKIICKDI